jgi:hypothetical protein
MYRVVLDANVLYPASLRDLLLRCDQAVDLKNPPLSVADVLDTLAQHVPTTVGLLRTAIAAQGEPSDSAG